MSFVTEILTPIIQMIVYVAIAGGIIYWIYFLLKMAFPNLRYNIKYDIFRKGYKEEEVKWCIEAIENGWSEMDVHKYLLVKGQKPKRIKELLFVFNKIQKKLKGGQKDNGKVRPSDEQAQIFQNFQEKD